MANDKQESLSLTDPSAGKGYKFGTFKGVFTPSILTILGVIMFLRLGWVLGSVGLPKTLLIVTMASSVTFLTGLSLSALATNKKVGGGGAYYIISRSLGLEVGSAIGIPLYCAQALSIAFYVAGFSEALVGAFPFLHIKAVAVGTLVVLAVLAYISADLALRTQFIVLGLIIASLVSFFAGGSLDPASIPPAVEVPAKAPFWIAFAVFFPAVTGIEVGIAMSGDLRKPERSLPLGTLSAVVIGYLVYCAIPFFLNAAVPDHSVLLADSLIMRRIARWGIFILLGVWAATLSSAMGSLLGAPRTLQALARDRIVPGFLGRGFGEGNDPRIATAVTFLIALGGVLVGGLNVIGPVLSMFFLASYGMLNVSAGLEEMAGVPSWRPTFRVPFWISLLGAFACFSVMFMINAGATIIASVILAIVYYAIKRRRLRVQWGDMRYGILMMTIRRALLKVADIKRDESTWQPNILVFSGAPTKRWYLVELANVLSLGRGFITVATVLTEENWSRDRYLAATNAIKSYLRKRDILALTKVIADKNPLRGVHDMITSYGFGPLRPNVILLGETEKQENFSAYADILELVHRTQRNLVIVRENKELEEDASILMEGARIDVWIRKGSSNKGLMCTLAYLMKRSPGWEGAQLIVKSVIEGTDELEDTRNWLREYIEDQRIEAEVEILEKETDNLFDTIRSSSEGADLVFLGMRDPAKDEAPDDYAEYYREMLERTHGLPPTALVLTSEDLDFDRIFDMSR